jgi:hypothetical protein
MEANFGLFFMLFLRKYLDLSIDWTLEIFMDLLIEESK